MVKTVDILSENYHVVPVPLQLGKCEMRGIRFRLRHVPPACIVEFPAPQRIGGESPRRSDFHYVFIVPQTVGSPERGNLALGGNTRSAQYGDFGFPGQFDFPSAFSKRNVAHHVFCSPDAHLSAPLSVNSGNCPRSKYFVIDIPN